MNRRDLQLDAMVRHLGAAYYQVVHGEGSAIAVGRALESVDDARQSGGTAGSELAEAGARARSHRGGRWRVRDVMSTDVVTVKRGISYKQVARLMTEHRVKALPVVASNQQVLGLCRRPMCSARRNAASGGWPGGSVAG